MPFGPGGASNDTDVPAAPVCRLVENDSSPDDMPFSLMGWTVRLVLSLPDTTAPESVVIEARAKVASPATIRRRDVGVRIPGAFCKRGATPCRRLPIAIVGGSAYQA